MPDGVLVTKAETKYSSLGQESLVSEQFREITGDVLAEVGDMAGDLLRNGILIGRGRRLAVVEVISECYAITYAGNR